MSKKLNQHQLRHKLEGFIRKNGGVCMSEGVSPDGTASHCDFVLGALDITISIRNEREPALEGLEARECTREILTTIN